MRLLTDDLISDIRKSLMRERERERRQRKFSAVATVKTSKKKSRSLLATVHVVQFCQNVGQQTVLLALWEDK